MRIDAAMLRERAGVHRIIHGNRLLALEGTSEGAAKGWETRRGGAGHSVDKAGRHYVEVEDHPASDATHVVVRPADATGQVTSHLQRVVARDTLAPAESAPDVKRAPDGRIIVPSMGPKGLPPPSGVPPPPVRSVLTKPRGRPATSPPPATIRVPSMGPKGRAPVVTDTGKRDPSGRKIVVEH